MNHISLWCLAVSACTNGLTLAAEPAPPQLVVHEWAVQIRSSAVVRLTPAQRFGRPPADPPPQGVLGPPRGLLSELPPFVARLEKEFTPRKEYRNWNKPVVHLYGPEGLEVTAKVLTPQGRPLVYYPKGQVVEEMFWIMGSGASDAVGLEWKGKLRAEAPPKGLLAIEGPHWWKAIREVPSSYFQTDGGTERFIFYEAVAAQEPTVTGTVSAEALTLENAAAQPSGPVVVILNDNGQRHVLNVKDIPADGQATVRKDELLKAPGEPEPVLASCRAQWEAFGMTAAEARAIVETWKPDLLDRNGFLVIARLPADLYEKMFPLTVTPKPREIVRVGLVYDALSGEGERLGWLPGVQAQFEGWAKELGAEDFEVRQRAGDRFAQLGDLARPYLERLHESGDAEQRNAAGALLEQLKPGALELKTHGNGSQPVNVKR